MIDYQIIIQARMGSSRFPGKVMQPLLSKPMLTHQIRSLKKLEIPIVIATSNENLDTCIEDISNTNDLPCVRGSEADVFHRFSQVIQRYPAMNYIRITADCPLISPAIIQRLVKLHSLLNVDYCSNTLIRSFPDGLDVEIFTHQAFSRLSEIKLTSYQKEHVTPGFYENKGMFSVANLLEEENLGDWRWTIDYPSDLHWLKSLLLAMNASEIPEYQEIKAFILSNAIYCRKQGDTTHVEKIL